MPRKNARLSYWAVDARNFTLYITLAFAVGAGPNLADEVHPLFLFSIAIVAAIVAFTMWLRNRRKTGIGVYIHLPQAQDPPNSGSLLKTINKLMNKNHRDWFRSGPEHPTKTVTERVEWTLATIRHRLDEAEARDGQDPPLFLYVHCHLEESFVLGFKASEIWRNRGVYPLLHGSSEASNDLAVNLRVRSLSTFSTDNGSEYELDLSRLGKSPSAPRADAIVRTAHTSNLPDRFALPRPEAPSLAIIIHDTSEDDDYNAFLERALEAASGKSGNGYLIKETDQCDHALSMSIPSGILFSKLNKRCAEPIVQEIYRAWREASHNFYGETNIKTRVFMKGPSILAFAVGAFLPYGSRLVAFDSSLAAASSAKHGAASDLVAIIDGDDVGAKSENYLLSGDLGGAIEYSDWISDSIVRITDEIVQIPAVSLVSAGGDSAIFTLPKEALSVFVEYINRLRKELSFKVSCGYGKNSKDAFIALRLAKTSGKNLTVGNHQSVTSEPCRSTSGP